MLLLDEMTAALPADLAERVLDVVRRQTAAGRSVIFISHRLLEIAALCDRATVLRDGETVGVVDIAPGAEERIVELMLGARIEKARALRRDTPTAAASPAPPRLAHPQPPRRHQARGRLLRARQRRGRSRVVALEGQGQDELFGALSGSVRPAAGSIEVDGRAGPLHPPRRRHPRRHRPRPRRPRRGPADAALGPREYRAALQRPARATGARSAPAASGSTVGGAIERLQIDTRAQREVQRLSGGNQQKVTIARWIAAEARTILCFDPTRGIDVRTKQEIYRLLRDLAAQGKSVLFYTSELEEVQLVADRVVVDLRRPRRRQLPRRDRRRGDADPRRLRPAAGRRMIARRSAAKAGSPASSRSSRAAPRRHPADPARLRRRRLRLARPRRLPYAFATAAQAVVVIAGGVDLSVASMMALTSVTAARMMDGASGGVRAPRRAARPAAGPRSSARSTAC